LDGALVDTSFLISLAKPAEGNHAAARQYYKSCLDRHVPLYLSTVVVAEFSVKQSVMDLELRNFVVLPFNIDHAMKAGQLWNLIARDDGDSKAVVKDDLKLIAQCACEGSISHLLTGDDKTLAKYLRQLAQAGQLVPKPIVLSAGFDAAWFDNGQAGLPLA
jgi:predicted nucleic acid-binding protein